MLYDLFIAMEIMLPWQHRNISTIVLLDGLIKLFLTKSCAEIIASGASCFNNDRKRFGIKKGEPIIDPTREYLNFELSADGEITYKYKRTVIDLGNIDEGLKAPWEIRKLGVKRLKLMDFRGITDEDVKPSRTKYKVAREKVRKLDENLDKRSKEIESSSTTNAEAIEMIEVTSKDIDTTVKDVEQDTSFIEPSERDKLLPLRELEGLDKQRRTIKGSLK